MVLIASVPDHSIRVIKLVAGIFPLKTLREYKAATANEKAAHRDLIDLFLGQTGKNRPSP